ncbi:MAG: precorrin-8X methylmutase [Nitrospirota bacterium]
MEFLSDPRAIESRSFEIIEGLLEGKGFKGPEKEVLKRVVHATADPEFADLLIFSEGAVAAGISAIASSCNIITDVNMLRAGITKERPGAAEAFCFVTDQDVKQTAKSEGITRSAAGIRKAAGLGLIDGSIVATGNAPTALFELMRLLKEGVKPALIVGVPVGFVGAAESKEALEMVREVPFITNRGRKGGTPVAAAVVNAIIKLANQGGF